MGIYIESQYFQLMKIGKKPNYEYYSKGVALSIFSKYNPKISDKHNCCFYLKHY
jgi:hypothetical protein